MKFWKSKNRKSLFQKLKIHISKMRQFVNEKYNTTCHLSALIGLAVLVSFDVSINSFCDYENLSSDIHILLFGSQIIGLISIFCILLLSLTSTFPFQVGMIRTLLHSIYYILWLHLIYFGITCLVCRMCVVREAYFITGLFFLWLRFSFSEYYRIYILVATRHTHYFPKQSFFYRLLCYINN